MRVSHIRFRKKLEEEKSKITDAEFFTSGLFRGYLADIVEATSRRYKKPIKIILDWDEQDDAPVAFTDNKKVYINAANPLTAAMPTRAAKSKSLVGILAHETGHILYSDFEELAHFAEALENGRFYPSAPQAQNETEEDALAFFPVP